MLCAEQVAVWGILPGFLPLRSIRYEKILVLKALLPLERQCFSAVAYCDVGISVRGLFALFLQHS